MKMTKEEIKKRIKECEAENEAHKTLVAKNEKEIAILRKELNRPKYNDKRWRPKLGEEYWRVISFSSSCGITVWDEDDFDRYCFATGNIFPTKGAAEFELERRKVIAELSDYAEGDDAVWNGIRKHWYIYYDMRSKTFRVYYYTYSTYGGLYFPSEEAATAAIEAVGADRVKKYYLGVRE